MKVHNKHLFLLFGIALFVSENVLGQRLIARQDILKGTISIYSEGTDTPLVVHNAKKGVRPYIHPINAPDGKGVLTEYKPHHHQHQTGLYWGFTVLNSRDYFRNLGESHWRYIAAKVIEPSATKVVWQITYHLLDDYGSPILEETQIWSMSRLNKRYILDLEWRGKALTAITVGEYYAGGLFLRMPWWPDVKGEVVNSSGQRNQEAEAQRAVWTDVGIQVPGRDDLAHIVMFDHPSNSDFPLPWRVDGELGVGPCRAILGDWKIEKNDTEVVRHRLMIYTGTLNKVTLWEEWNAYIKEMPSVK
ncbi:MAG TPA: DUF6807 family protein [Parapedobacter sp.]|nr:DUF6807 family protein [Parapedobacter sp.]